jgi:hypothetical protein
MPNRTQLNLACRWQFVALIAWLPVLAGCESVRLTEPVEGYVKLDGRPLPEIRVSLEPKSTGNRDIGVGSYGITDAQGRFVMRLSDSGALGAVVGLHSVILSDKRIEVQDDAGWVGKMQKSRVPEKYSQSPQTFEVRTGKRNEMCFDLTTE